MSAAVGLLGGGASSNPSLTIVANAPRVADYLRGRIDRVARGIVATAPGGRVAAAGSALPGMRAGE